MPNEISLYGKEVDLYSVHHSDLNEPVTSEKAEFEAEENGN